MNRRHVAWLVILLAGSLMIPALSWATGAKESAGTTPGAAVSAEPLGKYDPGITITLVREVGDTVKFPKGDSLESNVWAKAYKDTLGITLSYVWTASTVTQYQEKVNVAIASGDIPDFMSVDKTQLARLAKTDLIRKDLRPLYEKYGSALLKTIVGQEGTAPIDAASFNGQLCGLPSTGSSIDGAPMLWLRADWLKKLGLSAPRTYDEFLKVLDAFVTKDPNGTGKDDYIGLALNKDLVGGYAGYEGFCNMFGAYPGIWIVKNGRLVNGSYQPEMRTALLELQKLYNEGRVDKEFAVKDGGKESELSVSGRNGLEFGQMWNSLWPLQSCKDMDPKSDWMAYALPTATKAAARPQISLGTGSWYVVSPKAKNPEAILKMLNLWVEKAWGQTADPAKYLMTTIDGSFYEVFKFASFVAWPAYKNLDAYRKVVAAAKSGDTSAMNPEELDYYKRNQAFKEGNDKEWGYARVFGENGSFRIMDQYVKDKAFMMNAFYGADTATQAAKGSSLAKLEMETFTKIILGAPIEEFDKFVASVAGLGASDIEKEVNEWYAASKK
jgi:putative aldouronate transport system substrate-binding protein